MAGSCPKAGIAPPDSSRPSDGARAASGECINALAPHLPMLFGGSADLGVSNNTDIKDGGSFQPDNYAGRIIHFGVREHAMGSTMTGIALNGGLIPFGGTFLCFSDYMRPPSLAAISGVQASTSSPRLRRLAKTPRTRP